MNSTIKVFLAKRGVLTGIFTAAGVVGACHYGITGMEDAVSGELLIIT